MEKKRNYNIDFLRGIATLCILLIHTTFWSGEAYLPRWFIALSMLIDVPAFMFISGITFNFSNSFSKNIKGIVEQWKKWIYFLIYYILILAIFFRDQTSFKEIFNWLFYSFPSKTKLIVTQGSIWFIPMYILVTIISTATISLLKKHLSDKHFSDSVKAIIITLLVAFLYSTRLPKTQTILLVDKVTLFYLLIYFIGYYSNTKKISTTKFIVLESLCITLFYLFIQLNGLQFTGLQKYKFPPNYAYLLFSSISIVLFWYLKDKLKIKEKNPINFIGKNAIFYYYAQGISSSILIHINDLITIKNIWLKFITMFGINLIIGLLLGTFLTITYSKIINLIKQIKNKNNDEKVLYFPKA